MAEAHAEAVHAHQAPTGFIRKYIFSLDHKVIGKQYYVPTSHGLEKRIAERMDEIRKGRSATKEPRAARKEPT